MQYEIDTSKPVNLNWNAKADERILQNVINLINTWKYEVAYNRLKGIETDTIDKPHDVTAALYVAEVYRVVGEYETRAEVKEVTFKGIDDSGNMQFRVVVDI